MERRLVETIKASTEIMFHNFYVTLVTCNIDYVLCGMPIWKHCYHALHSCDQWFINPTKYEEPPFHEDGLNSLDFMGEKVLSREELLKYFEQVKAKIMNYLNTLKDEDLYENPEGYIHNRLECIIGQMRHFYCHLGNINATTIIETDKWPRVIGMSGLEQGLDKNNLYEE
ncbi:MAG: hypothetical protein J1F37_07600 [Oscillospiraceae bacterium]|nr:hypothetical protein [Oscillospiraceae bacterium]